MIILAVDTATDTCSVALAEGEHLLAEITGTRMQTHSRHLMGMIDSVFRLCDIGPRHADGFAVSSGPGSFTGLRIGISTIKGMAMAGGKPMSGILVTDVLAAQVSLSPWPVCVLTDARKGEVYCARYHSVSGIMNKDSAEQVLSPESAISGIDETTLFVGNGAELYHDLIRENLGERAIFAPRESSVIRASVVARLAWSRFQKGERDDVAAFTPCYVRKSDKELGFGKPQILQVR
ncbi:MAG: tRNA (adenosine(37)-N6)-threonylcarbamoyltransferase complex dimerization subunit type 1 TsaB [Desulfococcaceae bacterium]